MWTSIISVLHMANNASLVDIAPARTHYIIFIMNFITTTIPSAITHTQLVSGICSLCLDVERWDCRSKVGTEEIDWKIKIQKEENFSCFLEKHMRRPVGYGPRTRTEVDCIFIVRYKKKVAIKRMGTSMTSKCK